MFVPVRTDRPPRHMPVVTGLLIAVNVVIYLAGQIGKATGTVDMNVVIDHFSLDPMHFRVWQLITYQFMHDPHSIWHVAFNMLFLWVFGAPVEDRLRQVGFLVFYLLGGAAAGLAHMWFDKTPAIGASGSVAACTGAFLALFPRSRIMLFYLFTGSFLYVPSMWFVALYFVIDVLRWSVGLLGGSDDVAHMAHIAGYIYGFSVGFVLLATKILPREEYDVFFLFRQWRRRAAIRAANRATPAGAWDSATADTGERLAKRAKEQPLTAQQIREMELRADVNRLAAAHDLPAAAAKYRTLLQEFPQSVFNEHRQLELANQLCAEQDHQKAAAAYELLLARFPNIRNAVEVQLILAVIYARNLHLPERARHWIDTARPRLRDPQQTALVDALVADLPVSSA